MKKIFLLDTTLRDGAQGAGISFSIEDKLKIAKSLDALGIDYIEAGWPGSNPKDALFFSRVKELKLKTSKIVAFGSTRHKDNKPSRDPNLVALVKSKARVACIFGKTWDLHVTHALRTTLENNIEMIYDSVKYLGSRGLEVIYDAEHYFDGFNANAEYAIKTLEAALEAGASFVTLCETNGGMLPHKVQEIVKYTKERLPNARIGVHTHNDSDNAVANSLMAVVEGATLVQGTINGYGERCGNANLCSIIPALELKMGFTSIGRDNLVHLTEVSRYIDGVANLVPIENLSYVGRNAFAHKAGIHVSAMARHSGTYEHMDPKIVGNERRILISELSGKSNVAYKFKELSLDMDSDPKATGKIIQMIKDYEHKGYQFEDADGTFTILAEKALGKFTPSFTLKRFKVIVEKNVHGQLVSEATVKLDVNGTEVHTVAEGDGPVNALDTSLRKALVKFYPEIDDVSLVDFKVRVINAGAGTAAKVRALVESRDSKSSWGTIGVSENLIDASWKALVDSIEYKLLSSRKKKK